METHPLPPDLASSPFHHTLAPSLNKTHACEAAIGYKFQDPWLLWEALQAAGPPVSHLGIPRYEAGNLRLAIVGDRILDLLLALHWYPTGQKRVAFDTLRHQTTTNVSFTAVGNRMGLSRYITKAMGAERTGLVSPRTMSATVEAVIGAVYLDGGVDAARLVVGNLGIWVL
ncbi:MAG: hypothetical protein LQ349_002008 [Xanthoria aureola]|nr:MAG: hypothetical protein LQ349_002008 [Xanthoria aureola]